MATITLEVPDELAAQIARLGERLPELLTSALQAKSAAPSTNGATNDANSAGLAVPLYREITDFLATTPTAEQLMAFTVSRAGQERLADLLDKNREESLTADETAELDAYLQARDLMVLLKANAQPEA